MIEENLKNISMQNFLKVEETIYKKALIEINRLIIDLLISNDISYDYQYLNNRTRSLKLYNGESLEEDEENNAIHICQYNQLGEKINDEDEVINLIHEYLHVVSFRNYEQETDIGNLYYGFDEFCTEFITFIICMKLGLNYETYYKKHSVGYIDEKDHEFMKNISKAIDLKLLLEIYFTGNRDLLEQSLSIDLLLDMNGYLDYYLGIYESFNKPRKVVNEILKKPVFEPQRKILDHFVDKITIDINNIFDKKDNINDSFRRKM